MPRLHPADHRLPSLSTTPIVAVVGPGDTIPYL